jgi:hypothetical protein
LAQGLFVGQAVENYAATSTAPHCGWSRIDACTTALKSPTTKAPGLGVRRVGRPAELKSPMVKAPVLGVRSVARGSAPWIVPRLPISRRLARRGVRW